MVLKRFYIGGKHSLKMDYLVKLLFISGRFLTQVAGRTILQVYYKSVDIHQSLALKYYKVTQLAGNNENMLDLINSRVQEIGIHEGKLSACIGDDLYSDLNKCKTANSENLEAFINIDLTKYLGNKAKKHSNTVGSIENISKSSAFKAKNFVTPKHETGIASQYASTPTLLKTTKEPGEEPSIFEQINNKNLTFTAKHSSLSDITEKIKKPPPMNSEFEICKLIVTKKVDKRKSTQKTGSQNAKSSKPKSKPLEMLPVVLGSDILDNKKPILITGNEKPVFIAEDSKDLLKIIQKKIKVELEKHGFQDVVIPVDSQKKKNRKNKISSEKKTDNTAKLAKIKKQSEQNANTKKVLESAGKTALKLNDQLKVLSLNNLMEDNKKELNIGTIQEHSISNKETLHLHHTSPKMTKGKVSNV